MSRPRGLTADPRAPQSHAQSQTRTSSGHTIVLCRPFWRGLPMETAAATSTGHLLESSSPGRHLPLSRLSPHSPSGEGACLAACPGSPPTPFTPRPTPSQDQKQTFAEHTAALGQLCLRLEPQWPALGVRAWEPPELAACLSTEGVAAGTVRRAAAVAEQRVGALQGRPPPREAPLSHRGLPLTVRPRAPRRGTEEAGSVGGPQGTSPAQSRAQPSLCPRPHFNPKAPCSPSPPTACREASGGVTLTS